MRRMLLVAAILAATAPAMGQTSDAVKELTTLAKETDAAMLKNDTAFFDRVMVDDYMFIGTDGDVVSKAQMVKEMKNGILKFESLEQLEDVKVRVYGDAGVVTGRNRIKVINNGKSDGGTDRWTDVYVKRNGKWQCVSSQVTRLSAESEGKKP